MLAFVAGASATILGVTYPQPDLLVSKGSVQLSFQSESEFEYTVFEGSDLSDFTVALTARGTGKPLNLEMGSVTSRSGFYFVEWDVYTPSETTGAIQVFGDSISTTTLWPRFVRNEISDPIVSNAVGGLNSLVQSGVSEVYTIDYPVAGKDTITPGTVELRAERYSHGSFRRGHYAKLWLNYSLLIDEVQKVEFFNNGVKIGEEWEPYSFPVWTNYSSDQQKIFTHPGHELSPGDIVHFDRTEYATLTQDISRATPTDVSISTYTASFGAVKNVVGMPHHIVRRQPLYVSEVGTDWLKVSFSKSLSPIIDLGSDGSGNMFCVAGYRFDWEYDGSPDWDISIRTWTKRDDWAVILAVGTNNFTQQTDDFSVMDAGNRYLKWQKSVLDIIDQTKPSIKEIYAIGPFIRHSNGAGENAYSPDSITFGEVLDARKWLANQFGQMYIDVFAEFEARRGDETAWLLENLGGNLVAGINYNKQTGKLMDADGTDIEPGSLSTTPREIYGVLGPITQTSWVGYDAAKSMGYLPVQFRNGSMDNPYIDKVHPNRFGQEVIADVVLAKIHQIRT